MVDEYDMSANFTKLSYPKLNGQTSDVAVEYRGF